MFHLELLCLRPVSVKTPVLVYLDFETSGLCVHADFIVEVGLLEHANHAVFSTVVCPPVFSDGTNVHGIEGSELQEGPVFREAFQRMCRFIDNFANCPSYEE